MFFTICNFFFLVKYLCLLVMRIHLLNFNVNSVVCGFDLMVQKFDYIFCVVVLVCRCKLRSKDES